MKFLIFLLDMLIPRFIEEWVCLYSKEEGLVPAFPARELMPSDSTPDAMVKVRCFTWFLMAFFPKYITDPISYAEFLTDHWEEK